MPRDCVILLTHRWSASLARHAERLKREASRVLDVFVVLHSEPGRAMPAGMAPDFIVQLADAEPHFPARFGALAARGWAKGWGSYVDLIFLGAFLHPRVADYDRFWLVEYDVDLKGHWGRFFESAGSYDGDLLFTRVHRLSDDPGWHHAGRLRFPESVTDPVLGLFCISRISRPLLDAYVEAMRSPEWDGHFEAVIPTFANLAGFSVAEISGQGDWTPPERTNLHYTGSWRESATLRTTYSFRPVHRYSYFAGQKRAAGKRDTLYHPIKSDLTLRQRLRSMDNSFRINLKTLLGH